MKGVCVFITAVPLIKLVEWGEGESVGGEKKEFVYYYSTFDKVVRVGGGGWRVEDMCYKRQ